MTIGAGATHLAAAMLNVNAAVALGSLPDGLRGRLVRMVAVGACDQVVHREPGVCRCVEGTVASRAVPGTIGIAHELEA